MTEGRCMKCKEQVEIKNPKPEVMKNGMNAVKGTCPECGTKVFRIVGRSDAKPAGKKPEAKKPEVKKKK